MKASGLSVVLLGWLGILVARAQPATAVLTGRVTEAATGRPLPFAHVFINTTTRGTTTDEGGRYQLTNVPLGTVEVVASYVGYQTYRQTLRLTNGQKRAVNISLTADSRTLADVTVLSERSRAWERNLRKFKNELLGNSLFTNQCVITNEKMVRFTEEGGHLKASAPEPLLIENKALGYRIRYELLSFDTFRGVTYYGGTSQFDELKPENDRQADRWQRNRQRAYQGSIRHLLASLIAGTYEREGFRVYQSNLNVPVGNTAIPILAGSMFGSPRPVRADSLFGPGELPFERRFMSRLPLEVFYTKLYRYSSPYRDMPYAYSLITLPRGVAEVTTDGWVQRPDGMEVRGYLGNDRLANLLPADWRPADPAAADNAPLAAGPIPTTGQVLPPDRTLDSLRQGWQQRSRQQAPAVFVHMDKPLYLTGDRLYLSAYVLDPTAGQPIEQRLTTGEDQTPALHVEFVSPGGKTLLHQWLRITNGRAATEFRLSDTLRSGTYRLRAYTDPERSAFRPAFERLVPVYSWVGETGPAAVRNARPDSLDVQLLPEGGRWVAGLPARLGVKITGSDGHGRSVTGRIVDAQGGEVTRFITNRLGMGRAELTPKADQTYRVELDSAAGRAGIRLPPVEPDGLVLSADWTDDPNQLLVRVRGTGRSALQPVYLILQNRGRVMRQAKLQLRDGGVQITLPTGKLPPGLTRLTLYDAGGRPWAERLVFVQAREPAPRIELTPGKPAYQSREQIVLGLHLTDGTPDPLSGMLSASVTDAGQLPADTLAADFRAHWLLTGDLRGTVEEPGFYVRDTLVSTRRALDDLLVTQGWRRFNGQPPTGAPAAVAPADTLGGIALSGQVLDAKGNPLPRVNLLLTALNTNVPISRSVKSDDAGRFRVGGLLLADTVRFQVRVMNDAYKPMEASIRTDAPGGQFGRYVPDSTAPPDWTRWRAALAAARARQEGDPGQYREKNARQLKEVTVKAYKPRAERPDDVRRMSLHSEADATLVFDENSQRFANVYEMLRGRVPGVSVLPKMDVQRGPTGGYSVVIRGASSFGTGANSPLYIWDGNYIQENADGTALFMINPGELERVEVLKNAGAAMYGARGGTGVIAFYSKKWRPGKASKAAEGVRELTVYGFPTTREFYVPRYVPSPDGAGSTTTTAVDRRDVLYWKPLIQTDGQGQAVIAFPLSDVARMLRITVQGVTAEGQPVSSVQVLNVR